MTDPTPGVPDHAAPAARTIGWSPKAVWATVTAVALPFLLQGAAALVEALSANPALFDGLPAWLRFGITTVVTGLGVMLAAYRANPGNVVEGR